MNRIDGRKENELRKVKFTPDYVGYAEGSVLIEMGETIVLCNASVQKGTPRWMDKQGVEGGWITSEYSLLPRSTQIRSRRETNGLRGRTQEIRRLIGRSLRAGIYLEKMGPRTIIVDCDVLQADGGTRTASVTGGYVALALALNQLINEGKLDSDVFRSPVAAISVGLVTGHPLLDLCYQEDVGAEADINVVINGHGDFIEVQGTAESAPFNRGQFDELLDLAALGVKQLIIAQQEILSA